MTSTTAWSGATGMTTRMKPRDVLLPLAAGILVWLPLMWLVALMLGAIVKDGTEQVGLLALASLGLCGVVSASLTVMLFPLVHRRRTVLTVLMGTVPSLVFGVVRTAQSWSSTQEHGVGGTVIAGVGALCVVAAVTSLVVGKITVRSALRDGELR